MTTLGIILFSATVLLMLYRYYTARRVSRLPSYGYAGAAILVVGEILMFAKVEPVATYFTSIAWTGYILWADAAVFSLRGNSLLATYRREFAWIACCSIPLWLIFEAYNLRLRNWIYVGIPQNWFAQTFGYAWAFATIWPAVFETAALLRGIGVPPYRDGRVARLDAAVAWQGRPCGFVAVVVGAVFLILPPVLPAGIRPYLFGAVWLGFLFLLEPINFGIGAESLWRDWEQGYRSRLVALLAAGLVCGIFWEFWNFWAQARWVYIFPIFSRSKIFAMPLPGYLGFPPFALECFAMFAFLTPAINFILEKIGSKARFRSEALQI
jgi:hypothetical protein